MEYKIFIAGSKKLEVERDACRSVCSKLQNSWGTILTKTFEDFSETISEEGHQNEYNNFIRKEADLVIFIFSGSVGNITRTEYQQAYESFKHSKRPKILVYFDKQNSDSEDVLQLKKELNDNNQYYQEYENLEQLKSKVRNHINKILIEKNKVQKRDNSEGLRLVFGIPAIFIGIWMLFALIGGVFMYIVDSKMSEATCRELAIKYVDNYYNEKLIYTFPKQSYVYDIKSQSLTIHTKNNPLPASDVNIRGLEHMTFGATISLLLARIPKFKVKGNAKTIAAYIVAAVTCAIGCGVGCVIEQMLFPPQYSDRMQEYLSIESNWHNILTTYRKPSRIF